MADGIKHIAYAYSVFVVRACLTCGLPATRKLGALLIKGTYSCIQETKHPSSPAIRVSGNTFQPVCFFYPLYTDYHGMAKLVVGLAC